MRHFLRGEQWQSCLTWCPIKKGTTHFAY